MNKYSFDDVRIGRLSASGKAIGRSIGNIDRPAGIAQLEWYKFAEKIIKLLNKGELK